MSLSKATLKKPRLDEVFEGLISRLVYSAEDALDESSSSSSSSSDSDTEGDHSPPAATATGEGDQADSEDGIGGESGHTTTSSSEDEEPVPFCQKNLGLASPLWWWTHRAAPNGGVGQPASIMTPQVVVKHSAVLCQREAKMIYHLLQWLKLQPGGRKQQQQPGNLKRPSSSGESSSAFPSTITTPGGGKRLNMKSVKVLTTQDVLTNLDVLVREKQEDSGVKSTDIVTKEELFAGAEFIQMRQYTSALIHADWNYDTVNKRKIPPLGSKATPVPEGSPIERDQDRSYCAVAIWALGHLSVSHDNVENFSGDVGEYGSAFLRQAQEAAIVISDAGWTNRSIPWTAMRLVREKLENGFRPLRTDDIKGGMFGPGLPIVCPFHPTLSRTTVSGVESFNGFCRQLSLQPYSCGEPGHISVNICHMTSGGKSASETKCPYTSNKKLPCGHPDKMECGAALPNCLKIKEIERPCSHQEIESYDPETHEPKYVTVVHKVKGPCCQDLLTLYPNCTVKVPTFCRTCNDQFLEAECHEVTRASKEGGMQCQKCIQKYKSIRNGLRVQVETEIAKKKEDLKIANRKTRLAQEQNARNGLFMNGQLVRITSFEGARYSQEDQYEDIVPVDGWFEGELSSLSGQQGTIVGFPFSEGDDEMQYCIKLQLSKEHVMMAESGLALVQTLTVGPNGSENLTTGGPLMITAGGAASSQVEPNATAASDAVAPTNDDVTAVEGDAAPIPETIKKKEITYDNLPALGQMVHIHTSTVVPLVEEVLEGSSPAGTSSPPALLRLEDVTLPSVVVKVIGHASEDSLRVEFTVPRPTDDYVAECDAASSTIGNNTVEDMLLPYRTFKTIVPAAVVSPLFPQDQRVVVSNSEENQCVSLLDKQTNLSKYMYHVSGPEEVSGVDLQEFDRQVNGGGGASSGLSASPKKMLKKITPTVPLPSLTTKDVFPARLGFEAACVVVGFCNPPLSVLFPSDEKKEGASTAPASTGDEAPAPSSVQNPTFPTAAAVAAPHSTKSELLSRPGPYYILRPASIEELNNLSSGKKKVKIDGRTVGKKDLARNTTNSLQFSANSSAKDLQRGHQIALVSIPGVSQDAQYEAEKAMATGAREELEKRTQAAFQEWLEEEKVRIMEKTVKEREEAEKRQKRLEMLRAKRSGGGGASADGGAAGTTNGATALHHQQQRFKSATVGQVFTPAEIEAKEAAYVIKAAHDRQELETARKLQRKALQSSKTGEDEQWQRSMEAHVQNQRTDDEYFKKRDRIMQQGGGVTAASNIGALPSVRVGGVTPMPRH